MTATAKFKDFEIRQVNDAFDKYEVVKWGTSKDKPYCFVIAFVTWNDHEPCWELKSVGLRFTQHYSYGLCKFINDFFALLADPYCDNSVGEEDDDG